ncbi:MAG: hypothetical protein J6039_01730 [Alphaproteobacteria bacterium]|nr:hypothetical protein [Alphaproteobacteria bacterium]
MDITSIVIMVGGLFLAYMLFRFIIRLPFYLMTFAILGGLGYAAYVYLWPMIKPMLSGIM